LLGNVPTAHSKLLRLTLLRCLVSSESWNIFYISPSTLTVYIGQAYMCCQILQHGKTLFLKSECCVIGFYQALDSEYWWKDSLSAGMNKSLTPVGRKDFWQKFSLSNDTKLARFDATARWSPSSVLSEPTHTD